MGVGDVEQWPICSLLESAENCPFYHELSVQVNYLISPRLSLFLCNIKTILNLCRAVVVIK